MAALTEKHRLWSPIHAFSWAYIKFLNTRLRLLMVFSASSIGLKFVLNDFNGICGRFLGIPINRIFQLLVF